jgi:uncharacterized membrane protein YkoI
MLAVTTGAGAPAAALDRDSDQERVRRAFENGEILPITDILAIVAPRLPGEVVEVELDVRRYDIYYEVEVFTPTGRGTDIVVNARTGAVVERDRDDDQERARRAFENGEILPITDILAIVAPRLPGEVLKVELDLRRYDMYYEVEVLTPTGRVSEIIIDARTGAAVEVDY